MRPRLHTSVKGPSHRAGMESMFGFGFKAPLTNLREYVSIVKKLLLEGSVNFDGRHYRAHASIGEAVNDVPVMASALRPASFEFCGAEADGAISWVCPGVYLRDVVPTLVSMSVFVVTCLVVEV